LQRLIDSIRAGRYVDLEAAAGSLLEHDPQSGIAWKALSVSLSIQGKPALHALEMATRLLPDDPETHSNLGNALSEAGRFVEAVECCRYALQLNPNYSGAHNNLGNALWNLGQPEAALACYQRALDITPEFPLAQFNKGKLLLRLGEFDAAAQSFRRATAVQPDYVEAYCGLASALRHLGLGQEALAACRRALDFRPDNDAALCILAELYTDQGRFVEAEELLVRARSLHPGAVLVCAKFAYVRKMTADDTGWLAQAEGLARQPLPPHQAATLHYAMGKYFDDLQDFDRAFAQFRLANRLARTFKNAYDRDQHSKSIDAAIQMFDRSWLARATREGSTSERPVFIVGMPRSGTTLTEHVLCSHPSIFGAGELTFWKSATDRFLRSLALTESTALPIGPLAEEYLRLLAALSPDALRVVDKMPANFLFLGLIHGAFPNARILHVRRHPIDTCLSLHFQHFEATHSYANDLDDLAHYYRQYSRLMQHWSAILPPAAILDVPYESLVTDAGAWTLKLLDFIGLPWDANCMSLNHTERPVLTASKWQVRQPINSSSVDRWRRYEKHLGPLQALV
jgi:tetratricopeptide (TPR) repeat protein